MGINATSDKNYVYDLEFNEYFESNNLIEVFKNLLGNFVRSYIKVLLTQPLEIVRLVLQVGKFNFSETASKTSKLDLSKSKRLLSETEDDTEATTEQDEDEYTRPQRSSIYDSDRDVDNEDEDEEPINYFQSQNEQQVWSGHEVGGFTKTATPAKQGKKSYRDGKRDLEITRLNQSLCTQRIFLQPLLIKMAHLLFSEVLMPRLYIKHCHIPLKLGLQGLPLHFGHT